MIIVGVESFPRLAVLTSEQESADQIRASRANSRVRCFRRSCEPRVSGRCAEATIHAVVTLSGGAFHIPTQTEVQRELGRNAEVVLQKPAVVTPAVGKTRCVLDR